MRLRKANQTSGRKTAKAKNRAALSAQQTIPYVAMHPDGVCKQNKTNKTESQNTSNQTQNQDSKNCK